MSVTKAQQLNECYNEAFRCGDLGRLVLLYEENALLAVGARQFVRGREEIRNRLRNLLASSGTLSASNQSCVEFENAAMLHCC